MTNEPIGPHCLHKDGEIIYVEGDEVAIKMEDGWLTGQEAAALKSEPEEPDEIKGQDYSDKSLPELKELAKEQGLSTTGNKPEILARLNKCPKLT